MSDTIVLRKVFALDPTTNLNISTGNTLFTNGLGGTSWLNMISSLTLFGGPIVGNLPSTISSFSTLTYLNDMSILSIATASASGYSTLSSYINTLSNSQVIGTAEVAKNLASFGYISSPSLDSTIVGLGTFGYISAQTLSAAMITITTSPSTISSLIPALSSFGYTTLSTLSSFTSSMNASLNSTIESLGSLGYVSTASLNSTVAGLGTAGYVSTASLNSTVAGLGKAGYVSSQSLFSTVIGLGTAGYISTLSLNSTIEGLSKWGYISSAALLSTSLGLTNEINKVNNAKANIRWDTVTNVTVIGGVNIFSTISGNAFITSTFYQSSLYYSGIQPGKQVNGLSNFNDLSFSTAVINLSNLRQFIDPVSSIITIDVLPTIAFTCLGSGATGPAMLFMSTMLQTGPTILSTMAVTNFFYAGNYKNIFPGNSATIVEQSNIFNQLIRLTIPRSTISQYGYDNPYVLYHSMPSSLQWNQLQNALDRNAFTPYFGSTGSIFVSVQNNF